MTLKLSIAKTAEEREACYRLRYDVNTAAGKEGDFLCHRTKRVVDEWDRIAVIQYVEDNGRVVGTMRSVFGRDATPLHYRHYFHVDSLHGLVPEDMTFTSRLVIETAYRNSQVLPMMLGGTYHSGRSNGARVDLMHCAPALVTLYERLGYQCYARGIAHTDVGSHVPMLLLSDDLERLQALGSPFGVWATLYPTASDRDAWFRQTFPDYADGMTPALSSVPQFLRRAGRGLAGQPESVMAVHSFLNSDATEQRRWFRRATLIRCRRGDIVASSTEAFGDLIVQLNGASTLVNLSEDRPPRSHPLLGAAVIDTFLKRARGQDLTLHSDTDSDYLIVPARDLPRSETPWIETLEPGRVAA